jgi:hypothetical protein
MKGYWKKLTLKLIGWLLTECLFNVTGLDDLANYSEYVFDAAASVHAPVVQVVIA